MDRISSIEIAGKLYPLNFSMNATKRFSQRYGAVENIWDEMSKKRSEESMDEISWMLSVLIEQGCEYKRIVENDTITPISEAELEIVMNLFDFKEAGKKIQEAILCGIRPEIEVEIKKKAKAISEKWMHEESRGQSTIDAVLESQETSTP